MSERGTLLVAVDSPGMEEWVRSNFGQRLNLPPPVQLTNHLLEAMSEIGPELVLLSRHLPGEEPVGLILLTLRKNHPRTRVILLVGELDDEGQELVEIAVAHGVFDLIPGNGPIQEETLRRLILHPATYADAIELRSSVWSVSEDRWSTVRGSEENVVLKSARTRLEHGKPAGGQEKRRTVTTGTPLFSHKGVNARAYSPPRIEPAGRAVSPVSPAALRYFLGKIGRFGSPLAWPLAENAARTSRLQTAPDGGRRTVPSIRVAKEVAVWSVKGGVGKTTVVANLLACARSRGMAVAGLDADVRACGLLPAFGIEQPERGMEALPEMLRPECFARTKNGIFLLPGRGRIATAVPEVPRERFLGWLDFCRKHFELTILDLDPLAEEIVTLSGLQAATAVYVVVESFLPSVEINRDKLQIFDRIPALAQLRQKCRLVINKWDGNRKTLQEIEERTGIPAAAAIPFDRRYAWAKEPYLPGGGEGKSKGPWMQLLVDVLQNLPERKGASSLVAASCPR